jgi:hypothetical protein
MVWQIYGSWHYFFLRNKYYAVMIEKISIVEVIIDRLNIKYSLFSLKLMHLCWNLWKKLFFNLHLNQNLNTFNFILLHCMYFVVCKIIADEISWDISQVDPRKTLEVCLMSLEISHYIVDRCWCFGHFSQCFKPAGFMYVRWWCVQHGESLYSLL